MRRFSAPRALTALERVRKELKATPQARYGHRLHGVLLLLQGLSCAHAARLLGQAPRTLAYWLRRFHEQGPAGLVDKSHPGRPRRLSRKQWIDLAAALSASPASRGRRPAAWTGKTIALLIERRYQVRLGARQCQRFLKLAQLSLSSLPAQP